MANDPARWPGVGGTGIRLTEREADILAALARGAAACDVARDLGLSRQHVLEGLVSAIGQLGATSKPDAVLLALRRGDIAL
jgi:DNA-binding NarL/FixJ family response regulator